MKSIEMSTNGSLGTSKGVYKPCDWVLHYAFLQILHLSHIRCTSLFRLIKMMIQHNQSLNNTKISTNQLPVDTVQPCDTTQERSDSDFGVNFSTIQFYAIEHNSKSNHWIELKLYQRIQEVFLYLWIKFQVNRRSERTRDIRQNRLYEFCYLLHFDMWTSYMARILFLKGCNNLFWEFSCSSKIFNELKHNFQ
jgi:hypothetical protein